MSLQMRRNLHSASILCECTCSTLNDGQVLANTNDNVAKCNALRPMCDMPAM
jgi:hypothetical protein